MRGADVFPFTGQDEFLRALVEVTASSRAELGIAELGDAGGGFGGSTSQAQGARAGRARLTYPVAVEGSLEEAAVGVEPAGVEDLHRLGVYGVRAVVLTSHFGGAGRYDEHDHPVGGHRLSAAWLAAVGRAVGVGQVQAVSYAGP